MIEQAELNFRKPSHDAIEDATRLVVFALSNGRWVKRKVIESMTGIADRTIRACASHDPDIISGNKGYRLAQFATTSELNECADRLISQGKKMMRRGIRLKRRAHERISASERQ